MIPHQCVKNDHYQHFENELRVNERNRHVHKSHSQHVCLLLIW